MHEEVERATGDWFARLGADAAMNDELKHQYERAGKRTAPVLALTQPMLTFERNRTVGGAFG